MITVVDENAAVGLALHEAAHWVFAVATGILDLPLAKQARPHTPLISLTHPCSDSGAAFLYATPQVYAVWRVRLKLSGPQLAPKGSHLRESLAKLLLVTLAGCVIGNTYHCHAYGLTQPLEGEEKEQVEDILYCLGETSQKRRDILNAAETQVLKTAEAGILPAIQLAAAELLSSPRKELRRDDLAALRDKLFTDLGVQNASALCLSWSKEI